jgi:hypothetical protein
VRPHRSREIIHHRDIRPGFFTPYCECRVCGLLRPSSDRMVRELWLGALCLGALQLCSSFMASQRAVGAYRQGGMYRRSRVPIMASRPSDEDLVKIFGRLAEKKILLDSSAGACCHRWASRGMPPLSPEDRSDLLLCVPPCSGCDGCPYRYDFDVMRSVAPKWLPTYPERIFDSDQHRPAWVRQHSKPHTWPSRSAHCSGSLGSPTRP